MPDSFSWLHLTDFHYGLSGQDCLWPNLREPFLESLGALHERCGPWQAVFFTGDFVQSGQTRQFEKMQEEVLDPLWARLAELGSGNAVLLAVPGNHDLYRPNPKSPDFDDPAMSTLLEPDGYKRIEAQFWQQLSGSYRRAIRDVFSAYHTWWKNSSRRPANVVEGALPGDFSATITHGKHRIGIIGLNTTFLQLAEGNYEGRLAWNARQLHAVCDGGVDTWTKQHDVCLLLTHQGPDWLTQDARKHGETEIAPAGRFAAQLFGHQHETKITYIRQGGSKHAILLCQGCSVFGLDKFGDPPQIKRSHGYTAGRIEFGAKQFNLRLWPRIATDATGPWRYVADNVRAHLKSDEGTTPEPVALMSRTIRSVKSARVASGTGANIPAAFIPHSTLPIRRPFFGRKPDLAKIAKYLLPDDRSWGVVLDGPGGFGKTALALEAAYQAPSEHFPLKLWITAKSRELRPDGVQPIRDHRVGDYYALLNEIGLAIGLSDISRAVPDNRPNLVRHALAHHRALMVMDNVESFSVEDRRRLFELLGNLPAGCRAIVTSRRRTDGSSAAYSIRLDKLEREAADELLAELGHRNHPVARLSSMERDSLYTETGGNPLLLTWTASQLGRTSGRCHTVAEAIERLHEAHRLEKLSQKNDPLEFVFGDLVETLTDNETTVLGALVHFTQPARTTWLLPLTKLSAKAAETALDDLRDRSLVVEDDLAGTWWLPPLTASFLRRARPDAVDVSGDLFGDWAYAYVLENGYTQFQLFPALEEAWPQLRAALPLLASGDSSRLQEFCEGIVYFLDVSGRWDEILFLHTEAEAKAKIDKNFSDAILRVIWLGAIYHRRDQSAELKDCADRAAEYAKISGLGAAERMWSTRLLGQWYDLTGNSDAALDTYREAVKIIRTVGPESRACSTALGAVANLLRRHGQLKEAERHVHEALAIARTIPDPQIASQLIGQLAELALDQENWPEAERLAREALSTAEEICEVRGVASLSIKLAEALIKQGRGSEGHSHAEHAVRTFTSLRSKELGRAQAALSACKID